MPRRPKPFTDPQRVKAQVAAQAVKHVLERTRTREAEIRKLINESVSADQAAAQKAVWDALTSGASPTLVAELCGVSRATLYKYRTEYEHSVDFAPVSDISPWEVKHRRGEIWEIVHPDLGPYLAQFEQDDTLTIWREDGVYKPISREKDEVRDGGPWSRIHEAVYEPLRADYDKWVELGMPDVMNDEEADSGGLGFMDDDADTW